VGPRHAMRHWLLALVAAQKCEFEVEGSLCLNGGQQVLSAPSVPDGLVGHWTFDNEAAVDASGLGHDGVGTVEPGPPFRGVGASGVFEQGFILVPDSPALDSPSFSYSLWALVGKSPHMQASADWCPLLEKGAASSSALASAGSAPALLMSLNTGQLQLSIHTQNGVLQVLSNARLRFGEWTHLAVTRGPAGIASLYVNGVLDAQSTPDESATKGNELPLYLGGTPWTQDSCHAKVALDEVKAYKRALTPTEVLAEVGSLALGGLDFARFGCCDCTAAEAASSCAAGYHVCTSTELHTGAQQVADRQGWTRCAGETASVLWTGHDVAQQKPNKRVGVCCEDL